MSIIFFILGTSMGSFLMLYIDRLLSKESVIKSRSHCNFCKRKLTSQDLIPIIGFLIQKGRCRFCKEKIPRRYLIVEIISGMLLLAAYNFFAKNSFLVFIYFSILVFIFFAIFLTDLKYFLIPDKLVFFGLFIILFFKIILPISGFKCHSLICNQSILTSFLGAGLAFLFFFSFYILSKGKIMGAGDAKLALMIGLAFNWSALLSVFLVSFFLASAFGIIMIAVRKWSLKTPLPLGSFISLVAIAFTFFPNFSFTLL